MTQNKIYHRVVPTLLIASLAAFATIQALAQDRAVMLAATNTVNTAPAARAVLPGKGPAQYDGFYAGESKAEWFQPFTGKRSSASTLGNGVPPLTPPQNWGDVPVVLHVCTAPR